MHNDHPVVLTVAGSDSSGGAGIQADLKTFTVLGCYGMSVVTALTAQNTKGVNSLHAVPASFVTAQLEAVLSDIPCQAIKIGMVHDAAIVRAVSSSLQQFSCSNIILDPVMIAKGGHPLLEQAAIASLKSDLIPLSMLLTPNIPEAEVLLGTSISNHSHMELAARELMQHGSQAVLLKGGHLAGNECSDCLVTRNDQGDLVSHWISKPRIKTTNTHGTGCTLSAAIACFLARSSNLIEAVEQAKHFLHRAISAFA